MEYNSLSRVVLHLRTCILRLSTVVPSVSTVLLHQYSQGVHLKGIIIKNKFALLTLFKFSIWQFHQIKLTNKSYIPWMSTTFGQCVFSLSASLFRQRKNILNFMRREFGMLKLQRNLVYTLQRKSQCGCN